MEDHSLNAT